MAFLVSYDGNVKFGNSEFTEVELAEKEFWTWDWRLKFFFWRRCHNGPLIIFGRAFLGTSPDGYECVWTRPPKKPGIWM